MAVEHVLSDLITQGYGDNGVDPTRARGQPVVSVGTVTAAADGSSGSTYHLIDLPADCILMPGTRFQVNGWAYAQVVIGTLGDTDALLDVARAAATTQSPVADFDAGHGLPLWQRLGMSARPSDNKISLYAHSEGAGTQAGTMKNSVEYLARS